MKKLNSILSLLLVSSSLALGACSKDNSKVITIAASELPHAKILKEAIAPIVQKDGYSLEVTVLDWTQQNAAVARGEYDANYFQHLPYLESYNNEVSEENKLTMTCKIHFEKLCLYAKLPNQHKTLQNGDSIEIVNDITNIERALLLLKSKGVLTEISPSCYVDGEFKNFDVTKPNSQVTFSSSYSECSLTCLQESLLPNTLINSNDYQFGIIPGNTALTGFGSSCAERIVFGEDIQQEILDLRANGIAVKKGNEKTPKSLELIKAFADNSVKSYINSTFGESVVYNYIDLTK